MSKSVLIDTNIFLRVLVDGELSQRQYAKKLLERVESGEVKGIVSLLVINELVWIIEKYYRLKRHEFIPEILDLLSIRGLSVYEIQKSKLKEMLEQFASSKLDWTEVYLYHLSQQNQLILETFDIELQKIFRSKSIKIIN